MTGTAANRGRRLPDEFGDEPAAAIHLQRRSEPVAGAPGWRVVERPRRPVPPGVPQLAPGRSTRRVNPLLPWVAGAALSLLVLALTVVDQSWLDGVTGRTPATPEPSMVVLPLEDAVPPAPESASVAPPTLPAPFATLPPRIVPISPEGRGTAGVGTSPGAAGAEAPALDRSVPPPEAGTGTPRVVPISLERPPATLGQAMQLGAVASESTAGADLIDFSHAAAQAAPEEAATGGVRLFIHYGTAQAEDAATAARLAEYLRYRGFEVAAIRPVEFLIESAGVRYFFERDHAESQRLLEDLDWFFRGMPHHAPVRASDFTHYTPRPRPGTVEVWLPAAF